MDQQDPSFSRPGDERQPTERPSPLPGVTWNLRDIITGIVAALVVFFVLGAAVVGTAIAVWGEDAVETQIAEVASVIILDLVFIGTVLFVVSRKGAGLPQLGFRSPNRSFSSLLGLIVVTYVASILVVNIYGIIIDLVGLDDLIPGPQLEDDLFDHDSVVVVTGIAVVLMAPIAEEVFFRGFIFGGLRRYLSMPIAGLISGLLFALPHGDPGLVIPFAIVGLILAYTYERAGSLWAPIGVHFVFNSVSFLLLLAFPEWR